MLHRMDAEGSPDTGGIKPQHLRRCLQYLVDHDYSFISLRHLVLAITSKQALPPKAVVFTMDDGFLDQAEIAAPIFHEFDCPLTFFVITGMLDQALWPWDAKIAWITTTSNKATLETELAGKPLSLELGDRHARRRAKHVLQGILRETAAENISEALGRLARDAGVEIPEHAPEPFLPMNWDMARELERKGVEFAPHSVSHHILARLDKTAMEKEIHASWNTLKKELASPAKLFCYPTGRTVDFGDREIEALKQRGFLGAVATTADYVEPGNNPEFQLFKLPRFALPDSMEDFIQYCTWIEYAKHRH